MRNKLISNNLKTRILAPVTVIMILSIAALTISVISVQQRLFSGMQAQLRGVLQESSGAIQSDIDRTSKEMKQYLGKIEQDAVSELGTATREALEKEEQILAGESEEILRRNTEATAQLLAQVAPNAMLSFDFTALISYVKSATANPDIAFAVYLKPDGKPLTRYMNRKDEVVEDLIEQGAGEKKIDRLIQAARTSDKVIFVEKPVALEGQNLGTVIVVASRLGTQKQIQALGQRFNALIENNTRKVRSTIANIATQVNLRMDNTMSAVGRMNADASQKVSGRFQSAYMNITKRTQWVGALLGLGSILFMFVIVYFILTRLTRRVQGMVGRLDVATDSVAVASGQIASSSHQLSAGATEQAASIEESSSALEEMAAMTKQNSDSSQQADKLMQEANSIVAKASSEIGDLTASMAEITTASRETQKIVKTIDEIAFQTNLLALNAAVEAARAGEAGAGFAVVADEVRNLALRAAEAARNTSDLIEGTSKRVQSGATLVEKTSGAFQKIEHSTLRVGELVAEIAAASTEQAQGIEQINNAVTEMDKVVQDNAATSEETASASEEMRNRADQMKSIVRELVELVEGHRLANNVLEAAETHTSPSSRDLPTGTAKTTAMPKQMNPLDDEEAFNDF